MTLRVNRIERTTAEKEVNIYGIDRAEDQTKL